MDFHYVTQNRGADVTDITLLRRNVTADAHIGILNNNSYNIKLRHLSLT
jgi:hypothetical protein